MRVFVLLLSALMLVACGQEEDAATGKEAIDVTHDYFSFANTDAFVTEHLQLDLTVDFNLKELRGMAVLNMRQLDPAATEIILDTRDLHIDGILVNDTESAFEYAKSDPVLGRALKIELPESMDSQQDLQVKIHYQTDPGASALQWLPPELTAVRTPASKSPENR